jgi:hypothetical protein
VNAQHDRLLEQIQMESDDIASFILELEGVGQLKHLDSLPF